MGLLARALFIPSFKAALCILKLAGEVGTGRRDALIVCPVPASFIRLTRLNICAILLTDSPGGQPTKHRDANWPPDLTPRVTHGGDRSGGFAFQGRVWTD